MTDKQKSHILSLMAKAGYSTSHMNSRHKRLGATMRERSGSVGSWLSAKSSWEASELIDQLKSELTQSWDEQEVRR